MKKNFKNKWSKIQKIGFIASFVSHIVWTQNNLSRYTFHKDDKKILLDNFYELRHPYAGTLGLNVSRFTK